MDLLSVGGTYRFRVVAVYTNNDNKQGPNSARFTLEVAPALRPLVPSNRPVIVTAKPLSYGTIQITWHVSVLILLFWNDCWNEIPNFIERQGFYTYLIHVCSISPWISRLLKDSSFTTSHGIHLYLMKKKHFWVVNCANTSSELWNSTHSIPSR